MNTKYNAERLMTVLLAPVVSEKGTHIADKYEQVIFRVMQNATKPEVKAAVEMMFKVEVESVQIANAEGRFVFGVFLAQKIAGKPFTLVGDGTQRRDFLFVTDVADAFFLAATTDRVNEVYNLGAGNPQTVNRLIELLGGGEVVHVPKRPGEPDCTWADISKIQRDLGWKQQVSFEEGVGQMLKNLDYWREAPVWDPVSIAGATKNWFAFLEGKPA